MITVRRAADRGHFDHGWLDTHHTFSFADYHDPAHMGFRALRVINEDRVAPGAGFPPHPHRDMEIVTVVLSGAIAHRDSMGHEETLRPGEVQRMTAGRGVVHSEYNPSKTEPLHLYQIWIQTDRPGRAPEYEQKPFADAAKTLVVSPHGRDGSLRIRQDVELWRVRLARGERLAHPLAKARHAWVQVASGAVTLDGHALSAGDGASVSGERELAIEAKEPSELLVFDLA